MSRDVTEIDTDTPKGRLLAFCRMTGLSSNREIEKMLDLGNGYFRSADKGMNTGTLYKVTKKYPTLNLNWLVCGHGSIYVDDPHPANMPAVAEPHPYYNAPADFYQAKVPVRMFESASEFFFRQENSLPTRWFMLEKHFLRHKDDALVKITDDSLHPGYHQGEYLQITHCSESTLKSLKDAEKRLMLIVLKEAEPVIRLTGCYAGQADMYILSALNPDKSTFPDIACGLSQITAFWDIANVLHI